MALEMPSEPKEWAWHSPLGAEKHSALRPAEIVAAVSAVRALDEAVCLSFCPASSASILEVLCWILAGEANLNLHPCPLLV